MCQQGHIRLLLSTSANAARGMTKMFHPARFDLKSIHSDNIMKCILVL